jgi:hypothetical protein
MFTQSRQRFDETVGWLAGAQAGGLSHAVLEARLQVAGRELLRQLLQDHLDLRAVREERLPMVIGDDAVARGYAEPDHQRMLCTVFGQVTVTRIGYRAKGVDSRFVADAVLNLPGGLHSHGLRRLAAIEAGRGSFEAAAAAIERSCGVSVGKRQVEMLAGEAAQDVDAFYAARAGVRPPVGDVLVLTADAKGIVMRSDSLREPTRRAAAGSTHKMTTRLSRGEDRPETDGRGCCCLPRHARAADRGGCDRAARSASRPAHDRAEGGREVVARLDHRRHRDRDRRDVRRGVPPRSRRQTDLDRAG